MNNELPSFRYHPDPLSTGSIESSEEICECCGESRGYVLTTHIYATEEIEFICPWCVADGSASRKFDGEFVSSCNFDGTNLSESIIEEVTKRTPSFESWQDEKWFTHCSDACQFLGNPSLEELKALSKEEIAQGVDEHRFYPYVGDDNAGEDDIENYLPLGDWSFYKFSCLHCKKLIYYMDVD
ncbi:MAG: CbrC family protein [Chlamydiales bacterium]|nr:CbrC family protein [Chlamydiales bacterium]